MIQLHTDKLDTSVHGEDLAWVGLPATAPASPLLRQAVSTTDVDRWLTAKRWAEAWAEAEACAVRMDELAAHTVAVVPRRDHATPAGSGLGGVFGWCGRN